MVARGRRMNIIVGLVLLCSAPFASAARNVLMVTIDDLRPQLSSAYGMTQTLTPRLDEFAVSSITFHRAFCQQAVCSPSRNSFMTGRRPDITRVWNFIDHFRLPGVGENWTTLPQYFKSHGYQTYASGKLFHPSRPPNNDFPTSWTKDERNPYYWGNGPPIGDSGSCKDGYDGGTGVANLTHPLSKTWGRADILCQTVDDAAALRDHDERDLPQSHSPVEYDHRVVTRAIEFLEGVSVLNQPFFVAAGIRKPHLEWRTPHRFWNAYKGKTIDVAKHQTIGREVPLLAFEMNGAMQKPFTSATGGVFRESPDGGLPDELQSLLRRGYYSAVSYMDFEVGRLLDTLDRLGLTPNTAVLFFADHGWKLGEHGDWSKCSNWELDARVPLIIRAPWLGPAARGRSTYAFAELVDLYPTLVEMAELPPVPAAEGLDGTSLVPVLRAPDQSAPHNKTMAFSQYPRCPQYNMTLDPERWECLYIPKEEFGRMGYSVRDAEWRYTEWRVWWGHECHADWSSAGLAEVELYDHRGDRGFGPETFDDFEFENLAGDAIYRPVVERLAMMLRSQFDRGVNKHGCGRKP